MNERALIAAEELAERGGSVDRVLQTLRKLGLDDFGSFFWSLPNRSYPALSAMLPRMADPATQVRWTGNSGEALLIQSVAFIRMVENIYARQGIGQLAGRQVLDFGCGYGRLTRLMYYFSDPS